MTRGMLALSVRALRVGNRATVPYVIRFGLAGFLMLGVIFSHMASGFSGAAGLALFSQVFFWDAVFLSILATTVFSTVISEEKEEGTLGLLRMTGLSSLSLIIGKSFGPLIEGIFLLIVQLPFLLLAVTLGGVSNDQILAAGLSLMSFLILAHGFSVLASVVSRTNFSACLLTGALLVLFWIASAVFAGLVQVGNPRNFFSPGQWELIESAGAVLADVNIWMRLGSIVGTGFAGPVIASDAWCCPLVWGVCIFTAWAVFPAAERWAQRAEGSDGAVVRIKGRRLKLSPGRCWNMFSSWFGFHYVSGGWLVMAARSLFLLVIVAVIMGLGWWLGGGLLNREEFFSLVAGTGVYVGMFQVVFLAAKIFQDDVREQTLGSLWMLPCSRWRIFYGKAAGAAAVLLPAAAFIWIGLLLGSMDIWDGVVQVFTEPAGWYVIHSFLLLLHVIVYVSLFVKWPVLAVGLGLIADMMVQMLSGMIMLFVAMAGIGSGDGVAVLLAMICMVAWIAMHPLIGKRLEQLASR